MLKIIPFKPSVRYRHVRDFCTLDIKVLSVVHQNSERIKLKIMYINKFSNNAQYTGRGRDGMTDTVSIRVEDYDQWIRI